MFIFYDFVIFIILFMGPTKGRSAVDPRIGQWKDWIHNCLLMNLMIQATVSNIKPFTHISKLFHFSFFFFLFF